MARFDVVELRASEPKALGDVSYKLLFVGVKHTVSHGDVEQTLEHVLQEFVVALQQRCKLIGISLVAHDILLGEIKDARHILHFAFGHLKHFLEGDDFVARDNAVGLGHLGAKGDYTDGEGYLMLRVVVAVVVNNVASEGSQQPANWATHVCAFGKPRRGARQSSPNRHLSSTFLADKAFSSPCLLR